MDDIFSILIYIIIIISFLSSFFKKKNPQNPPQQQRRVPQDQEYHSAEVKPPVKKEVDDYDILREIENMFKTGTEKEGPVSPGRSTRIEEASRTIENAPSSENIRYEEYSSGSESLKTESEHRVTPGEHMYQEYVKKTVKVDKKIEEQAKKFQAMLEWKASGQDVIIGKIIDKMKNPATFREYIIVSEILGKPKALRR